MAVMATTMTEAIDLTEEEATATTAETATRIGIEEIVMTTVATTTAAHLPLRDTHGTHIILVPRQAIPLGAIRGQRRDLTMFRSQSEKLKSDWLKSDNKWLKTNPSHARESAPREGLTHKARNTPQKCLDMAATRLRIGDGQSAVKLRADHLGHLKNVGRAVPPPFQLRHCTNNPKV